MKNKKRLSSRKKWRKPKIFVCSTNVNVFTDASTCTTGSGALDCVTGNNAIVQ